MAADRLILVEDGRELSFSFAEMLNYHGGGSPGGVAHAFKVLERALPLLEPGGRLERRTIRIRTAFGGPGARDGFELVTRAVGERRFTLDPTLTRPQDGRARERFVFALGCAAGSVTLSLREGFVSEQFIDLARQATRSRAEEQRLTELKLAMAERLMAADATEVYAVAVS